jgi:hypothetical protein
MRYFTNIVLWYTGFSWFDGLPFKRDWTADSWKWRLLYTIDYGSHVLTGGAVVSWSRWFYDNREKYKVAKFFDRLLNHFEDNHGRSAGPPLWGSKDCAMRYRLLTIGALLAAWFLWA